MVETPTIQFRKSQLRDPAIVEAAVAEPVEILLGGDGGSLTLMNTQLLGQRRDVEVLVLTYLRAEIELARPEPSTVVLGEVGFIAEWPRPEQVRFMAGFAEALAESLRNNDPTPARYFVAMMSGPDIPVARSDQTGELSPGADRALRERIGAPQVR